MIVLGIESTCDETGCAIVRDGKEILSNVVASQMDLHKHYGGVVPELACRRHIDVCQSILEQSLKESGVSINEVDLVAVANGPGLIGALLVGLNFAKGLALSLDKPLIGVNHIEAHLYSALMQNEVPLPAIGVVISGGHTALVKIEAVGSYSLIGQTQDDAIGEAFDKVARLLDLPYPGGPEIERLAKSGDPKRFAFKAGLVKKYPFDFSFSGLKTAVLYLTRGQNSNKHSPLIIQEDEKADVAASFQHTVFSNLIDKILLAVNHYDCHSLILGGGVSQNKTLRIMLEKRAACPVFWPSMGLSLDNAAMIAGLGYHTFIQNNFQSDSMGLNAVTRIPFDSLPSSSSSHKL